MLCFETRANMADSRQPAKNSNLGDIIHPSTSPWSLCKGARHGAVLLLGTSGTMSGSFNRPRFFLMFAFFQQSKKPAPKITVTIDLKNQ
jgi:hypothetical protein